MARVTVSVGLKALYSHLVTNTDVTAFGTHCPSHNNTVTTKSCSDCNHNSSHDGTGGGCWYYSPNYGSR